MPPMKVCLGFQAERCTKLSEQIRCAQHRRAYEASRVERRQSPRQRGYDAEYEANRAILRATSTDPCVYCQRPIDKSLPDTSPMGWTADHAIPTSRGGSPALSNLRPAHNRCNNSRSDRV